MLDFLAEDKIGNRDPLSEKSAPMSNFEDALLQLDKDPWFSFVPLKVHAEFADVVLGRGGKEAAVEWAERLNSTPFIADVAGKSRWWQHKVYSEAGFAMAWVKPQYSKARVDWAGEVLSGGAPSETYLNAYSDYETATDIVNNWRAIHSYPLQAMKMTLKRRAKRIYPAAIVAQRLKRLASIKLKLKLSKEIGYHPNLSQMQDIGGCRAVMETVSQVHRLQQTFEEACKKNPKRGPQYFTTSDYIARPKENGYRSVHLVYKFRSISPEHSCYDGQRIELELRSRPQHYWATAVETYSTFSGEALKSNIGSEEWIHFFALVSSGSLLRSDNFLLSE